MLRPFVAIMRTCMHNCCAGAEICESKREWRNALPRAQMHSVSAFRVDFCKLLEWATRTCGRNVDACPHAITVVDGLSVAIGHHQPLSALISNIGLTRTVEAGGTTRAVSPLSFL
jgi:hypothetical protein